ncbi:MAG: M23 family metallopeptidase [Alphaproteobacteria bacterium]|nr:M23 family metallopeptidase [Alphaproteobacteria bacterium]
MRIIPFLFILFIFQSSISQAIELNGSLTQGGLIIGSTNKNDLVFFEGRKLRVNPNSGEFVFGIGHDHGDQAILKIVSSNGLEKKIKLKISSRDWSIEYVDGLDPIKVNPPASLTKRIRREGALLNGVRSRDTPVSNLSAGFILPVYGRLSGYYGNQRILNGVPRRPHLGVDIAVPIGTTVHSAADGEIVLTEKDLFYTGKTIVIDHGHGLTSIYSHLDKINVKVGEWVKQGFVIGKTGNTGRSSGPHLDWRINWFNVRVDPLLTLKTR